MDIEETKRRLKIMQAFVDGREIEECHLYRQRATWIKTTSPKWSWDFCDYRVKETVKPFPNTKEFVRTLVAHTPSGLPLHVVGNNTQETYEITYIIFRDDTITDTVRLDKGDDYLWVTLKELSECYQFYDKLPCGQLKTTE